MKARAKLGVFLSYKITAGGGFNQALNAISQLKAICFDLCDVEIFTSIDENLGLLKEMGLSGHKLRLGFSDKWITFCYFSKFAQALQSIFNVEGRFERALRLKGVDLIYFVEPGSECLSLNELNHISTVWDNAHRDMPEFPEVRKNFGFLQRENIMNLTLAKSILTICDSKELADKLSRRYGLEPDRLLAMPFLPSPFMMREPNISSELVLKKYGINENYFFYPAQFWSHKNHARIIEAFKKIKDSHKNMSLVFSGGDKGNLAYITHLIDEYELNEKVKILGFIPPLEISALYKKAKALVMPTYFGPTNLPPIEAWQSGIPVIYSQNFKAQVKDAAILVDPDSVESIAAAMIDVLNPATSSILVKNGYRRLEEMGRMRVNAENDFRNQLIQFLKRQACWKLPSS